MKKSNPSDEIKEKLLFRVFPIFVLAVSLVNLLLPLLLRGKTLSMVSTFSDVLVFSSLSIFVTLLFSIKKISNKVDMNNSVKVELPENILELDKIDSFTDREVIMICKILQNDKYDYIARVLKLSEITVKKAAATIYKKLGVTDKIDLFGKYANHSVSRDGILYLTKDHAETEDFKKFIQLYLP